MISLKQFSKKQLHFNYYFPKVFLTLFLGILLNTTMIEAQAVSNYEKALQLSKEILILDGHTDFPYKLYHSEIKNEAHYLNMAYSNPKGDFDLTRARIGGLNAAYMAVFIPPAEQSRPGIRFLADSIINFIEYIAEQRPEDFTIATTPSAVIQAKKSNKFAFLLAIENGAAIENDLSLLQYFKKRGVSYITLTHGKDNQICDSSYDNAQTWKGVSPFGFKVLDEMQKLGIVIDVAHISDKAFYQIMDFVKVPVVATHSSCRHFTPGFERNMSDDMILKLKKNKGLIMINFGSTFLDGDVAKNRREVNNKLAEALKTANFESGSDQELMFKQNFLEANKHLIFSNVQKVVDHIDHVVKVAGINHVGLGSDFDGVGDSLPHHLKDVSMYPFLIEELINRGYSAKNIKKICSGNYLRVWGKVQKSATM